MYVRIIKAQDDTPSTAKINYIKENIGLFYKYVRLIKDQDANPSTTKINFIIKENIGLLQKYMHYRIIKAWDASLSTTKINYIYKRISAFPKDMLES